MRLVAVVAVVTLCGPVTSARAQPTITVIDIEVPAIMVSVGVHAVLLLIFAYGGFEQSDQLAGEIGRARSAR